MRDALAEVDAMAGAVVDTYGNSCTKVDRAVALEERHVWRAYPQLFTVCHCVLGVIAPRSPA
jgi:hypothetical protein